MSDTLILTETRHERELRTGEATPHFLQGVFLFAGRGLFDIAPLDDIPTYTVPDGKRNHRHVDCGCGRRSAGNRSPRMPPTVPTVRCNTVLPVGANPAETIPLTPQK